jgi:hypothetical protein
MAVIRTQPGTSPRSPSNRASLRRMGQVRHGMRSSLRSAGDLGQRDEAWVEGEQDDGQLQEGDRNEYWSSRLAPGYRPRLMAE